MRFPVLAVLIAALTGCSAAPTPSVPPLKCEKSALPTLYAGIFTMATDQPAYPPWYIGDDPSNGDGFESAVAYAVADKLGYTADEVRWVRVPFNTAMAAGPKSFDANLSEFSITDQRRELVDFSSPYYDVAQAVVTVATSAAASATTLADLRTVKLGAQAGTTSAAAASAVGGSTPIAVYNTNVEAKMALRSGQIDALVLDLPTAMAVQDELEDGLVVGRLPSDVEQVEQFGIMLDKFSRLTPCVSQAVDELRDSGALAVLEARWLADGAVPPLLG
ncbi:amino acid ABC transporter substrate-binding protein [Mycobacterium sp. MS1601]|nr:amino acid ABC transporter substrate-binding protein [Mycobacterium sp. MS1601]